MLVFTVLLSACKKYKEGPAISFRSSLNRIEGTWKVDKLYINDIDSTNEYQEKLEYKIKLSKDKSAQLISDNNEKVLDGSWDFYDFRKVFTHPKNAISIILPKDTSFYVIGTEHGNMNTLRGIGEIRRLTNRELKIEYELFGQNNYDLNKIILELRKE